jgi:hypothetical protein
MFIVSLYINYCILASFPFLLQNTSVCGYRLIYEYAFVSSLNFFCKATQIYVIAVCFIPATEDLNWVMNFHFHDTCSEHSIQLCSFSLCQDTTYPEWIVMAFFKLSRIVRCLGHGYVIWYCVVSSQLLVHKHTWMIGPYWCTIHEREMSWYRMQRYIKYIIQQFPESVHNEHGCSLCCDVAAPSWCI